MKRQYFGNAAHLCVSDECRFHIATKIGDWLISTVGDYVAPSDEKKRGMDRYTEIGYNRKYETMVFRAAGGNSCACGCGLPEPDSLGEIDFAGYNTAAEANEGHEAMCQKYEALPMEASC